MRLMLLSAFAGCAATHQHQTATPIAQQLTEPAGTSRIWVVYPSDEMASDLVGEQAFRACRTSISGGNYNSCAIAIAHCMLLVVWADRNVLFIEDCHPSDSAMLLSPPDAAGVIHSIPVTPVTE